VKSQWVKTLRPGLEVATYFGIISLNIGKTKNGTAAELVPVVKVDGRVIGDHGRPGEISRALIKKFRELVKDEGTAI
jgi:hypothetical protein